MIVNNTYKLQQILQQAKYKTLSIAQQVQAANTEVKNIVETINGNVIDDDTGTAIPNDPSEQFSLVYQVSSGLWDSPVVKGNIWGFGGDGIKFFSVNGSLVKPIYSLHIRSNRDYSPPVIIDNLWCFGRQRAKIFKVIGTIVTEVYTIDTDGYYEFLIVNNILCLIGTDRFVCFTVNNSELTQIYSSSNSYKTIYHADAVNGNLLLLARSDSNGIEIYYVNNSTVRKIDSPMIPTTGDYYSSAASNDAWGIGFRNGGYYILFISQDGNVQQLSLFDETKIGNWNVNAYNNVFCFSDHNLSSKGLVFYRIDGTDITIVNSDIIPTSGKWNFVRNYGYMWIIEGNTLKFLYIDETSAREVTYSPEFTIISYTTIWLNENILSVTGEGIQFFIINNDTITRVDTTATGVSDGHWWRLVIGDDVWCITSSNNHGVRFFRISGTTVTPLTSTSTQTGQQNLPCYANNIWALSKPIGFYNIVGNTVNNIDTSFTIDHNCYTPEFSNNMWGFGYYSNGLCFIYQNW